MVPIHDTDVAEERWSQAEWGNYELWERVELRLKRQKRLWIFATFVLFIILSAIPIMIDRWPKWETRALSIRLAQEINWIKLQASVSRSAYRLGLNENLSYTIERVADCSVSQGELIKSASIDRKFILEDYAWFTPAQSAEQNIPGIISSFCYDHLLGSFVATQGQTVVGFGIVPVKDLAEKRVDRLSLILLTGASAEISFD